MSAIDALLERIAIVTEDHDDRWTPDEDAYLRRNLGFLPEEAMAEHLGRSPVGLHLRWKRDLRLPAPSKDPRYITARQLEDALGVDVHTICHWVESGMLKGEIMPGGRHIHRILKTDLVAWLLDPQNWVHFKIDKVRDPVLRLLLESKQVEWGDEWWMTPQVAEQLEINTREVQCYIKIGLIQARRVSNRAGRHPDPYWANWFVLRSEATRPELKAEVTRRKRKKGEVVG